VIKESDLREKLAQCPRLNVIVVRLADLAHPAVRRAVVRDLKVECLKDDPLALEDLLLGVTLLSHEDKLIRRGG
jgi:hypothetical protein